MPVLLDTRITSSAVYLSEHAGDKWILRPVEEFAILQVGIHRNYYENYFFLILIMIYTKFQYLLYYQCLNMVQS